MSDLTHIKQAVRQMYPSAMVVPTAFMFVVVSGGKEVGRCATTPERAWINAMRLVRANS